ncbi:MAG: hypothetical protein COA90_10030 [Gammaproteobacteria bacterium]|nr:MAG: hypothetical protein COA90_10030 [Gammaproteobacteria bacterium]
MFWKFGDLNITFGHKWTPFSGDKEVNDPVLYCEIESPETAGKFRFVAENIGGLFREGSDIVLGSLNGEERCPAEDIQYEIIYKAALVNYINVSFSSSTYSLFPKWDGELNEQPTSAQTAEWGAEFISGLIAKQNV